MAKRVTFKTDCDVPIPGAIVAYKAGHSGLIPEAHAKYAMEQGALTDGDDRAAKSAGEAEANSGGTAQGDGADA